MDRFRFGLAGLGGPLTERTLYGETPGDRLVQYGQRFTCIEAGFAAMPEFTADHAQAVLDRLPPQTHVCPRAPEPTDLKRRDEWLAAVRPFLLQRARGPIHVPWRGVRTDAAEERLEAYLASLWPQLPGDQRLAVEFTDPSWFRAPVIHLLEENGAGLVWSTQAGKVPYRLTADFIYVRLTGTSRHGDEIAALAKRVLSRPDDRRPTYVMSALHADPYGPKALDRFAAAIGAPWRLDAPVATEAGQSRLDAYAVS